jgi:hypothetical protein
MLCPLLNSPRAAVKEIVVYPCFTGARVWGFWNATGCATLGQNSGKFGHCQLYTTVEGGIVVMDKKSWSVPVECLQGVDQLTRFVPAPARAFAAALASALAMFLAVATVFAVAVGQALALLGPAPYSIDADGGYSVLCHGRRLERRLGYCQLYLVSASSSS